MSIRDLRTFLAIAEEGSFAAAARIVRRTQSAVTVQMRTLEESFGTVLFDRTKRPPLLNEAGRALVAKATEVVQAYDRLYQHGAGAIVAGHVRVGVVPSVITGLMPQALLLLRAHYPDMHVDLSMGLSRDLVERVHRGSLDAAIVSDLLEGGASLQWSPLLREPLVLIAPLDAPRRPALALVESLPFIRYARQAWVGQSIDQFLKKRRLQVNEAMTLDTLEAITTMVHHGLGVSIVPLRAGPSPFALPVRVARFPAPVAQRVIGLVHAPSNAKASLIEAMLETLRAASGAEAKAPAGASPRRTRAALGFPQLSEPGLT